MNKRIKKKHLKVDTQKEISPYRLRLLYNQVMCSFEKFPSLSVLTQLFEIICNVFANISLLLEDKKGENNV